jgi:hypothetical protein
VEGLELIGAPRSDGYTLPLRAVLPFHGRRLTQLLHSTAHRVGAMKTRQAFCWALTFCAFASITSLQRRAQARTCSAASDCPKGFDCEPGGVAADGGLAGVCVSLSCQGNSDCAAGFSCYIDMGTECVTAPDGAQSCGPRNACVPEWDAPCVTATDCGPGFTCPPSYGASYNCGKEQDASQPPYATVTIVPCSAVPRPPFPMADAALPPGFPGFPSICEAGATCTEVTWNTCVAQQTGPCKVDSDCPSTWTCGCRANCGGVAPPPGGSALDAGCMMVCIPPNSDLSLAACNGAAGGPSFGVSPLPSGGSDSGGGASGSGGSPAASGSSSMHGGCQAGSDVPSASWTLIAPVVLAAVRRRSGKSRPTAR